MRSSSFRYVLLPFTIGREDVARCKEAEAVVFCQMLRLTPELTVSSIAASFPQLYQSFWDKEHLVIYHQRRHTTQP